MVRVHDVRLSLGRLLLLSLSIRVLLTVFIIIITTLVIITVEWSISELLCGGGGMEGEGRER